MSPPTQEPRARCDLLLPEVEVEDAVRQRDLVIIDLRSPSEFEADHLPGAHNLPLFDDVERALVGTLYKQASPERAFDAARSVVAVRIRELMEGVARLGGWRLPDVDLLARYREMTAGGLSGLSDELDPVPGELGEGTVLLHCWRGGLRSRSVVAFARRLGFDAVGLRGGYKSYRRRVLDELEAWQAPPAYVLRGLTGVGKTLVLREVEALRPRWTLDLELHAGHRSSLLGMVGLAPCSQKTFETRLAARLRAGFPGPVVIEGESRKVGDAIIPASMWSAMGAAKNLCIEADVERRVRVLMDDYLRDPSALPRLRVQLAAVEERMDRHAPLTELFDEQRYEELVRVLLEDYYDPLYRHSERGKQYAARIDASDEKRAAREVVEWIEADLDRN